MPKLYHSLSEKHYGCMTGARPVFSPSLGRIGLRYNAHTLQPRKRNWLWFLILFLLLVAWPGYTLLKGLTFSTRKLERPNPTSYTFHAPIDRVRNAVDASFSSPKSDRRWEGSWMPSGLDAHGSNETEYDLHQIGLIQSDVYRWLGTPLGYKAEFKLDLTSVSDSTTQVDVQTSDSMVRIGPNLIGHGGDYCEPVAPTTIEEYKILLKIGSAVGESGMPSLRLPQ
jgi:hypothetical protein